RSSPLFPYTTLFRSTPLREYVIGTALSPAQRNELNKAYARLDSLEQLTQANDLYLDNLRRVMRGEAGETMDPTVAATGTAESVMPATEVPVIGPSEDELASSELVAAVASNDLSDNLYTRAPSSSSYTIHTPTS